MLLPRRWPGKAGRQNGDSGSADTARATTSVGRPPGAAGSTFRRAIQARDDPPKLSARYLTGVLPPRPSRRLARIRARGRPPSRNVGVYHTRRSKRPLATPKTEVATSPLGRQQPPVDSSGSPRARWQPPVDSSGSPRARWQPPVDSFGFPRGRQQPWVDSFGFPRGCRQPWGDCSDSLRGRWRPWVDSSSFPRGRWRPPVDSFGFPLGCQRPWVDSSGFPRGRQETDVDVAVLPRGYTIVPGGVVAWRGRLAPLAF
jgi:hypothetical protein